MGVLCFVCWEKLPKSNKNEIKYADFSDEFNSLPVAYPPSGEMHYVASEPFQYEYYRCEICKIPLEHGVGKAINENKAKGAIDHCHTCQKKRGMLCTRCNCIIGNGFSRARCKVLEGETLNRAVAYVEKHVCGVFTFSEVDPELVKEYHASFKKVPQEEIRLV